MTKIWTHNGQFHLDEIMAISVYESFVGQPHVIRSNEEPVEYDMAFDVGGKLDLVKFFDHHQDKTLPSTCYIVGEKFMPVSIFMHCRRMLQDISDCDRGIVNVNHGSFNGIIRNFNILRDGWEKAMMVAKMCLEAHIQAAKHAIADVERWNALEKRRKIAILDGDVILDWKRLAQQDGILGLICPNARGQGWHLISRDVSIFRITSDIRQTFLHNTNFMATYTSKKDAIDHARELISEYYKKEESC